MSHWVWFVVVPVVVGSVLFLRRSESDRIRDDLESMAEALHFDGNPQTAARMAGLKRALTEHVSNPVTIDLEPLGESSLDTDSLAASLLARMAGLSALRIDLGDIGVKLDPNQKRATAKGDANLDILDVSRVRRSEPRKFAVTLERGAKGWVIVHAQIAAPRIDQPEARP